MSSNPNESRKRSWIGPLIAIVGCALVSWFHYCDMTMPLPAFGSLMEISGNRLAYETKQHRKSASIEFVFTDGEKRYLTSIPNQEAVEALVAHLRSGPITLFVGPQNSPIARKTNMTIGNEVVVDYSDRVTAKKKEQALATPLMIGSFVFLLMMLGFIILLKRSRRPTSDALSC